MDKLKVACMVFGVSIVGACVSLPALLTTSEDYISLSHDDMISIPQISQKTPQEIHQRSNFILEEVLKEYKTNRSKYLGKVKHTLTLSLTRSIGRIESSLAGTQMWNKYFTKLNKCLSKKTSHSFSKDDIVDVLMNRARLISDMYTLHKVRENVENIHVPSFLSDEEDSYSSIDTQLNNENNRYHKIIYREADRKFYDSLNKLADKLKDLNTEKTKTEYKDSCDYAKDVVELRNEFKNAREKQKLEFEADLISKEHDTLLQNLAKDISKDYDDTE